ncbi:MAG: indolepyruvate ferredoxin oxidoreductase subunit alpha [Candidatus Adiutrix sp.]|jgi:indolepyruvate ferredoxin oxidoreductase alpha subunit|nr:indolepyruvate ferredoxin oxidoreductase subunit alpha [Candidatus Adiutrix sp.]
MNKVILSGDEAVARGAYEGGCLVAAAYPGTPSTEILENMPQYAEIDSRWASNEKVALEIASGASIGGVRALAAMKHVGLNVAADPLLTMGYIGVNGGLVVVTADDPGCHSSQNEQDNRLVAPWAKILMLEPSDSQECLDFTKLAFELSERFDSPALLRMTTRVCHSKGLVALGERPAEAPVKPYERNIRKTAMLPAHARLRHVVVEANLKAMEDFSNNCAVNRIEWGQSKNVGVITSGVSYLYAREVFGDTVSYLKLGLTHPLPHGLISTFARSVDKIYVIEEGEPYLETAVRALGFDCIGKERISVLGELDSRMVRQAFLPDNGDQLYGSKLQAPPRPPVLCAGCPHRGFFHTLGKKKKEIVACGDIGCYTLGIQAPLDGLDTVVCMGGGFSTAIGMAEALKKAGDSRKVFGMVGDSTFFHSGMTGLADAVHVNANVCLCVLDNSITAMTGHQENPGTKNTLRGEPATSLDILKIIEGMGVPKDRVTVVDPLKLDDVTKAVEAAMATEGLSIIVTKRPCVLIKEVRKSLEGKLCKVDPAACKRCKQCLKVGCPAISFEGTAKEGHSNIDPSACVGCEFCLQVCKFDAISRV